MQKYSGFDRDRTTQELDRISRSGPPYQDGKMRVPRWAKVEHFDVAATLFKFGKCAMMGV